MSCQTYINENTAIDRAYQPASQEEITAAEEVLGVFPVLLKTLYLISNGLTIGLINILPVYSTYDTKRTWESIQRLNSSKSPYLPDDEQFRTHFLLFALIGGPDFAAFNRGDESIWYSEDGDLHQTDI